MFPILTNHLVLSPLAETDREEFERVWKLSRVHFGPWMPKPKPEETIGMLWQKWLARAKAGLESGREVRLVAKPTSGEGSERVVGFFHLFQIERGAFQNATASWLVSADAVRQGYGTEGVMALLDLAFAEHPVGLGLHRVGASIIPDNVASVRLAERCGFRREALARDYLHIDGAWRDHYLYAKLAPEHRTP